jgi:two-component system, OmpR family, sensor kinase
LGLPMAKSILKAHGGSITVTSTENSGSTFTISLPLFSVEQNGNKNNET